MTRDQLLTAIDNALTILQNVYNPAFVAGVLDQDAAMQVRSAMYSLTSVSQSVKRDGQLRDLIESAK